MAKVMVENQRMDRMKQIVETEADNPQEFDPSLPQSGEGGIDLTLIHWMLSMTPAERIQVLQRHVRAVLKLRHDNPQL